MATQSVATQQRAGVGLHDALRRAGGARGEEDVGGVVGADGGLAALDLGAALVGAPAREGRPTTIAPRRHRAVEHDDRLEVGQLDVGLGAASRGSRCRGSR